MKIQSTVRKDVGHTFGILQARFKIKKNPYREYKLETMSNIMMCFIVLHNMIIQDEQGQNFEPIFEQPIGGGQMRQHMTFWELNTSTTELLNAQTHYTLRNDIIEQLWQIRREGRY